ncbi:MAG: 2-amino-5-chloromuconate deaminase CnbZ [Bryobacteraceae bacterium]
MRIENPKGGYAFLKGIAPYSAGAVAARGFEIVHVTLRPARPLSAGFEAVAAHLDRARRPRHALCAIELRSPRPFTFQGFSDFNAGYVGILKKWDILADGLNPVARTNVAPEIDPPGEPSMYGFCYAAPAEAGAPTFIVAGAGELPEGSLDPHDVVRRGETSPDAVAEKARFVMGLMTERLRGLGVGWEHATHIDVYTVHDFSALMPTTLLKPMGKAAHCGITWHYSRPPIVSIEFEMDVRGCRREL